jgi:hypothetical protein
MQFGRLWQIDCQVAHQEVFSAAHMHSTVPNTTGATRFGIDFRTVHLDDVVKRVGAPNIDPACCGTTLGNYMRGTDFGHLPKEAMEQYLDGTESQYVVAPSA